MTLINTISQAGYMTILFVVIFLSIGLSVLLFFATRHERKRFKENRVSDTTFKAVDFDMELKKRVADDNGKTKFTIITFYIENMHGVKQLYNAQNVDGMLDVVVSRLKRIIRLPLSVAVQERKQITLFASKHILHKELIDLVKKAIAEVNKPIAMPDSRQVHLELNGASVYYPGDGTEPIRLLNNLLTAVAAARRMGLSQYVAYSESLEDDSQNIGAYFEYQRQMQAKNVGIYFRRVIEDGSANSPILESQMRYRREEMNDIPILESASVSNDCLWLGRYFYEHSMSQLKRINDKSASRKKLLIRLTDSLIIGNDIVEQLSKAAGNNGLDAQEIIIGINYSKLKQQNAVIDTLVKQIKDKNFGLLLYSIDISLSAEQMAVMGAEYIEIGARMLTDGTTDGVVKYLDELRKNKIQVIAGDIDKAEFVKGVRDLGVKLFLGEVLSAYLTVKDIVSR